MNKSKIRRQGKICHLTSVHQYDDVRIFLKECQVAVEAGFETHLIAPNVPGRMEHGVFLHGVPRRGHLLRMTEVMWRVYRQCRAIDADLYHFHDPELLTVGLLLKLQKKKVIYDVHEDYPEAVLEKEWLPKWIRRYVGWVMAKVENKVSCKMDRIVAVTPHIGRRFKNLGCRTEVVYNYPFLNEFYFPELDWRRKERAVCFAGGITKIRGAVEMVTAIGLTDGKLILAGSFESPVKRQKVKALPGWQQIEELGFISRKRVGEVFGKSMAGLVVYHPVGNHITALPNKMFEYMAAGIPIICSNFPLWQEIVAEVRCGICVDPWNSIEIAAAIRYILDHPEEAQRMGENGQRAVREKYNWEMESRKLKKLYENMLSPELNRR
jgi:glycosyltransferase involved in cell wall biosynthesis